jgi:drug/metabolite transporter (DMT)-like permease
MALLVGMAFATNTTLAALAYRGGATPMAVLLARCLTACALLLVLLRWHGVDWRLPAARRWAAIAVGVVFAIYSYSVLVAIKYLPVGLVVATFYTFPLLVAAVEWRSGRQPFSRRTAAALVVAFIGILFALDVAGGVRLHRGGILLCLAGAIGVTIVMVMSTRVRGDGDSRPVTLHMLGTALVGFTLIALVVGGVGLPRTALTWAAFISGPLFYAFGIIALFMVMGEIGAVKASLIMNIEPVTSVVLGYLVLGQALHGLQIVGIALVVGAVVAVEASKLRW